MADLVRMLRQRTCWVCGGDCSSAAVVPAYCPVTEDKEAADEIERLQYLLETANAYGAAENKARIEEREQLAQMMIRQSLATGHGDTVADLVRELEPQIERLRAEVAALKSELKEISIALNDPADNLIRTTPQCVTELRRDAKRYRWLRNNISYYDVDADWPVEGANIPALAQVSNRIWYHATDDVTHNTLDEAVDTALGGEGSK